MRTFSFHFFVFILSFVTMMRPRVVYGKIDCQNISQNFKQVETAYKLGQTIVDTINEYCSSYHQSFACPSSKKIQCDPQKDKQCLKSLEGYALSCIRENDQQIDRYQMSLNMIKKASFFLERYSHQMNLLVIYWDQVFRTCQNPQIKTQSARIHQALTSDIQKFLIPSNKNSYQSFIQKCESFVIKDMARLKRLNEQLD